MSTYSPPPLITNQMSGMEMSETESGTPHDPCLMVHAPAPHTLMATDKDGPEVFVGVRLLLEHAYSNLILHYIQSTSVVQVHLKT